MLPGEFFASRVSPRSSDDQVSVQNNNFLMDSGGQKKDDKMPKEEMDAAAAKDS